jgi:hypothetical protein
MKNLIIITFLILPFFSKAQSRTHKIKSVICDCYENNDTVKNCFEEYFNERGQMVLEKDNLYNATVENQYDSIGRKIFIKHTSPDSFSNSTEKYFYYPDSTKYILEFENSYLESTAKLNSTGDTTTISDFDYMFKNVFIADFRITNYSYKNKKLTGTKSNETHYKLPKKYCNSERMNIDSIKKIFKTFEVKYNGTHETKYEYNRKGKIISMKTSRDSLYNNIYNYYYKKGKYLTGMIEVFIDDTTQIEEIKYNKKWKIIKCSVKTFSKREHHRSQSTQSFGDCEISELIDLYDYDKNGNLIKKSTIGDGKIFALEYYENGNIYKTEEFNCAGKLLRTLNYKTEFYP